MSNSPKKFVNLHAHDAKSMYDGFGTGDEHLQFALDNGLDGMAMTNHGNMNSFPECYEKAKEFKKQGRDFKFIPGVEAYYIASLDDWRVAKAAADQKRKEERETTKVKRSKADADDDPGVAVEDEDASKRIDKFLDPVNRRHHLVLLPKSRKGLENIFRLVSRSNREGYYRFPRIDARMLKEHGEDVVVSSACVAGVPSWATYSQFPGKTFDELTPDLLDQPGAREAVMRAVGNEFDRLCDAVGSENVFAEIQFNKLAPQHLTNRVLIEFAKSNGMKLVAAADSHYCSPDLWRAREVYKLLGRISRNGQEINPNSIPSDVKQLKCELYPKNAEQMWNSYKEYCDGYDFYDDATMHEAIENAWHVAHDVIGEVTIDTSTKLPSFGVHRGLTPFQTLVELCKEGMHKRRLERRSKYISRLKSELSVVKQLDNAVYFLTLKALVDCAREGCLLGPGRGSGAGSLINYVLGITDVDPVKDELIFARFMSIARSKNDLPDVDLDWSDRDRAINMLKDKFGEKSIIPISNFNTMQMKSLVKDVAKLHGVDFSVVNDAMRNLDQEVKPHLVTGDETKGAVELTYDACMEHSDTFKSLMKNYPEVDADVKILGKQPKAIGKHAGGIVVHEDPDGIMPLISVRGDIQTPWSEGMSQKSLGPYGICKYDFLALKTLRLFETCISHILKRAKSKKGYVTIELEDGRRLFLEGNRTVLTKNRKFVEARELTSEDEIDDKWIDNMSKM
jgi:DNA polymerase-3 subunit alpha